MPRHIWTSRDLAAKPLPPQPGIPSGQPEQHGAKVRPKAVKCPKKKQSESQQQSECVGWFRAEYPEYARNLFAIPNGGYRNPKTAAILKREGTLAGVPDTFLAIPRKAHHGLFIELKTAKGKPTEKQVEMMAILTEQGYRCAVAYSTEEFKTIIQDYLNAE